MNQNMLTCFQALCYKQRFSRFPHQFKAQRSGFELEATSRNTGEKTRLRVFEHCVSNEELVTRTGFEPMLKA